jgi:uncharacterized surface protein with fasciclin (FAS1) repeats
VRALQRILGVPETGVIDAATLRAAYQQGVISGTPPTTAPTTVPPDTTVPATAPPATTPPETTQPVPPPDPTSPSVLELLRADDRFTTLVSLLEAAGYTGDTEVIGPITVFAPTNDAFAALDPATLESVQNDPELLTAVLSYHVVEARFTLAELAALTELVNVYGGLLTIAVDGGVVRVNGAATIAPEQVGRNGGVIAVDQVLVPPTS